MERPSLPNQKTDVLIATTFGLWVQGASLGMILGPPVVASLATESSWRNVSWIVVGLAVAGVLLAFQLRSVENSGREFTVTGK